MWFIIFVVGCFTAIWAFDWWPFQDEITLYPAICRDKNVSLQECNNLTLGNPSTYTLNKQRAEATYVSGRGEFRILRKLVNCAIVDRKNWRCNYSDGSGTVVVLEGVGIITDKRIKIIGDKARGYVPRWRWHLVRAKRKFDEFMGTKAR